MMTAARRTLSCLPAASWAAILASLLTDGRLLAQAHAVAPTLVSQVLPIYPPIAQTAKIQGIVIIEAIIGKDGRVKEAKVLRPAPMLDQAALEAVRQWQYTPTLLNGVPVEVVMTVTVTFTLN